MIIRSFATNARMSGSWAYTRINKLPRAQANNNLKLYTIIGSKVTGEEPPDIKK